MAWQTPPSPPGVPGVSDRLATVLMRSVRSSPCAAPISGLFASGNLHYLHVKCCLVHHRKLNHGRFCISIWILRQKLRLINNKVLFCIFCNEFYCCCWPAISERKPGLHLGWSWSGVTLCLPNQFQTSKSNNNHVIVIKISPVASRAGEAFSGGWGVSSLKLTIYREPNSISNIFIISGNFPRLSWWSLELLGKLSLFGWSLSSLINYFPKPFSKISPQFVSKWRRGPWPSEFVSFGAQWGDHGVKRLTCDQDKWGPSGYK